MSNSPRVSACIQGFFSNLPLIYVVKWCLMPVRAVGVLHLNVCVMGRHLYTRSSLLRDFCVFFVRSLLSTSRRISLLCTQAALMRFLWRIIALTFLCHALLL